MCNDDEADHIMPLFLKTREPMRREKLILGGAVAYRHRSHRLRIPHRRPIKASPPFTAVPKQQQQARRRGVSTQRRARRPTLKKHGVPVRRRQQNRQRNKKKHTKAATKHTLKKAITKTGKRILKQQLGNLTRKSSTSTAKQVLNQLVNSRQIQHAVKGVVAQGSDLPAAAGAQLMRHVVNRSRKRPAADDDDDDLKEAPAKRGRFTPGHSRIGYRGKQIQRGGTKQQRGGGQFLF